MRLALQLFTEESMEAMIKYYEGETLGLGGKTAGSPGGRLQAHALASTLALKTLPRSDLRSTLCLSTANRSARARPACYLCLLRL